LFISGAAYAQARDAYVNRDNFFTVNFPSEPTVTETPYKTVKGTNLTARVFKAAAPAGSIQAGNYTVTVVDYSNAKGELGDAIEQARRALLAKGKPKYDAVNNIDMHRGWALTVETPDRHNILGQIVLAANNRLYVTEAETALNIPPPAQFQASLQILDENGVRIRTRTAPAAPAKEDSPVGAEANAAEAAKVAALVAGSWRNPSGGSCQTAYFKSGERTKTSRGEEAIGGTVVNSGVTIVGQLITAGAREGQFIDPKTDKAIMLFDPQEGKLSISSIGAPAAGWPDANLEPCRG